MKPASEINIIIILIVGSKFVLRIEGEIEWNFKRLNGI